MREQTFDILLAGGGLQSALIALAISKHQPDARICIVEQASSLGGNHTWSLHGADIPATARDWFEPLVVQRWPGWEVRFPSHTQTFATPYVSVTSLRLRELVMKTLAGRMGNSIRLDAEVVRIDEDFIELASGELLRAPLVVDARGSTATPGCGYQKFVGIELELKKPALLRHPILMDACVEQHDGFRFVYVLPFDASDGLPARVLIEETYFSDTLDLDEPCLRARARAYAERLGPAVCEIAEGARILRTERGSLPLPLSWTYANTTDQRGPLLAGNRGGFFHPTTGYSFPIALRLAELIAHSPLNRVAGSSELRALVRAHHEQARFGVLLNRLLFKAALPENRRDVLERFHKLPPALIGRFYGLRISASDRLRILCGRPPPGVSLRRALREVVLS